MKMYSLLIINYHWSIIDWSVIEWSIFDIIDRYALTVIVLVQDRQVFPAELLDDFPETLTKVSVARIQVHVSWNSVPRERVGDQISGVPMGLKYGNLQATPDWLHVICWGPSKRPEYYSTPVFNGFTYW